MIRGKRELSRCTNHVKTWWIWSRSTESHYFWQRMAYCVLHWRGGDKNKHRTLLSSQHRLFLRGHIFPLLKYGYICSLPPRKLSYRSASAQISMPTIGQMWGGERIWQPASVQSSLNKEEQEDWLGGLSWPVGGSLLILVGLYLDAKDHAGSRHVFLLKIGSY